MGVSRYVAKEIMKEIGNRSREFYEFVLPPVDIYEDGTELVVIVDLPGFQKKDIHVQLDFARQGQTLVCRIEDNGIGINQAQKNKSASPTRYNSHGISNIRTRVSLLNEKYNLHSLVTLQDKKDIPGNGGTGTIVTLSLPLEISES